MKDYEISAVNFDILKHDELNVYFRVLHELRTHLNFDTFVQLLTEASRQQSYQLVVAKRNQDILGLMGYRILTDFVHGKHLYVDDLVTIESQRSNGIGTALLEFAEHEAKKQGCQLLRLCTGVENDRGKIFYEKNGWAFRAVAFKKKIST